MDETSEVKMRSDKRKQLCTEQSDVWEQRTETQDGIRQRQKDK